MTQDNRDAQIQELRQELKKRDKKISEQFLFIWAFLFGHLLTEVAKSYFT